MALKQVESFTAGRPVTIEGVVYQPGDTIPNSVLKDVRNLSALISSRIVIPDPDPHQRRTSPATPATTHLTPWMRQNLPADPDPEPVDPDPEPEGPEAWQAETEYMLEDVVSVEGGTLECTTAGTSGTTEPELPAEVGQTVADGTVEWTRES